MVEIILYTRPTHHSDLVTVMAFEVTRNERNVMFYCYEELVLGHQIGLFICHRPQLAYRFYDSDEFKLRIVEAERVKIQ